MVKKDGESHNEEGEEGGQDRPPGGSTLGLLGGDVPLGPNPPPPPPPHPPYGGCFSETTEVNSTVQPKQNRFDFFIFLSGNSRFPWSRLKSSAN